MSTPLTATTSSTTAYGGEFWERLWRSAGIQAVVLFVVAYFVSGEQPQFGAPSDAVVAFYASHRVRTLVAVVLLGMALLNLMWFCASLRAALVAAGRDGWGAALTAASAAFAGLALLLVVPGAALAFANASPNGLAFASGLNDLTWAGVVLSSFPRAMLVMATTFGLWRARLISNALFGAGVAVVVLVLLGGTTWLGGFWAPDGAYSRLVSPALCLLWVFVASRIVLSRSPAAGSGW